MTDTRRCPECGAELPANAPEGLCPKCLLQAGLPSESGPVPDQQGGVTSPYGAGFTAPSPTELARHFPQLEILELLGQGGMGAVYKARQPGLDRLVALKILPPEAGRDPAFAERFTREARALAKLSHPNIVTVHDFGQTPGEPGTGEPGASATGGKLYYLLMEYVDGLNARQLLQSGQLKPQEALKIVPQICEALQYAHDEGIVHRDIKPENILLDKKGRVKIADFGLAKLLGRSSADFKLTATHQVMGTPHYMAPEQIEKPLEVDHRADIYSLGVVFYEMLTGELPLGRFAPPSQKVQIDVRLDEVVLRALEREPGRRYQQVSDVKTEIESITTGISASMTPRGVLLRPGQGPMLLLIALAMVFSALMIAGGVALAAVAVLTEPLGTNEFWGWMGGAFGCLIGGAGSLAGTWNSYRQMEGAGDLMQVPGWTWLDRLMAGYGLLGIVGLVVALVGSTWLHRPTTRVLLLLSGIVALQAIGFLVVRGLLRRASQQRDGSSLGSQQQRAPVTARGESRWEMWWFNRDAFTRNAIKTVLYLIGFGGMILFLSFTHHYQMAEGTETTVIKIGAFDPWFVYDVTKGRGGQFGIYFSWSLLFGVLAAVFLFALIKIESSEIRRRREQALARTPEQQGVGPAPTQSSAARSRLWKILGPLLVMLALVVLAPVFLPLLVYVAAAVVGIGSYLLLLLPEPGREILLYAIGLWLAGLGAWLLWKRRAAANSRKQESSGQQQGNPSEAAEKRT